MQFDTYTAAGAHIACWMANHPAAEPAALGTVLAGYDVHEPIVTWRQIRALEPWAGCLRTVSRNGRRRFCSLRCANQVNVASHRLRQRHAA